MDEKSGLYGLLTEGQRKRFAGPAAAKRALAPFATDGIRLLTVPARKQIASEGGSVQEILVLLEGECWVQRTSLDGARCISHVNRAFCIYGLSELLSGKRSFSASILAFTDCCIASVPVSVFLPAVEHTDLSSFLLRYFAGLLEAGNTTLARAQVIGDNDRLVMLLYEAAFAHGVPFALPYSREELAALINIRLRTLYRYVDRLEADGMIDRRRGKILITAACMERLSSYAQGLYIAE